MDKLKKWCERNGGVQALADQLGITYQAVQNWFLRDEVPRKRVREIAKLTGIALKHLNPVFRDAS